MHILRPLLLLLRLVREHSEALGGWKYLNKQSEYSIAPSQPQIDFLLSSADSPGV
jgi:hypothetical protein